MEAATASAPAPAAEPRWTPRPVVWTETRIELLKVLWADGLMSASEIAHKIGGFAHCDDGGRSAVLGKVHRLKLPERRQAYAPPLTEEEAAERLKRRQVLANEYRRRKRALARAERATVPAPVREVPVLAGRPCQVLDLDGTTCRWPNGEPGQPGFHFCGGEPATGSPYCGYHTRIAYQPRKAPT